MKLKRFNKNTLPARSAADPQIKIYAAGSIVINKAGCDLIGLKIEDGGIEFVQDEDRPKDWYIVPSNSPDCLKLREYKSSSGMVMQSSVLAKEILKSIDKTATIAGLNLACKPQIVEGEKLWAVITSSYKPKV